MRIPRSIPIENLPTIDGKPQPLSQPELHILHQDERVVIVNKPAGLLSVRGNTSVPNVLDIVKQWLPTARAVHRLDQHTSGILLLALDRPSEVCLKNQFQQRLIKKHYQALVVGNLNLITGDLEQDGGDIDWPIGPVEPGNLRQQCLQHGQAQSHFKPAHTHWKKLETLTLNGVDRPVFRVDLFPTTGRTHQLRVHMAALGTPILNDALYGQLYPDCAILQMALHASSIAFIHPDTVENRPIKSKLVFTDDLPTVRFSAPAAF